MSNQEVTVITHAPENMVTFGSGVVGTTGSNAVVGNPVGNDVNDGNDTAGDTDNTNNTNNVVSVLESSPVEVVIGVVDSSFDLIGLSEARVAELIKENIHADKLTDGVLVDATGNITLDIDSLPHV